ncbi:MAG: hypothetical protein AB1586_15290 [Pseudomonadota bacterium]
MIADIGRKLALLTVFGNRFMPPKTATAASHPPSRRAGPRQPRREAFRPHLVAQNLPVAAARQGRRAAAREKRAPRFLSAQRI